MVDNEEKRTFPQSGRWKGFYVQYQKEYHFTMTLNFFESSEYFYGYCQDEENDFGLEFSDVQGRWFQNDGIVQIEFNKHYRQKHDVDYKGEITENFTKIVGEYFGGNNAFSLLYLPEITTVKPVQDVEITMFHHLREYYVSTMDHFFDFEISCQKGQTVNAHKVIIASQSKFFEGFFRSEKKDSVILDFESHPVQLCIDFMYTANIDLSDENVESVLEVANYLGITCLIDVCAEYVAQNIDIFNCIEVAKLSSIIKSDSLSSRSVEFVVKNLQEIIDTKDSEIYQLPSELFRKVLQDNNLLIRTRRGNITPGYYREYHLLDLARHYVKINTEVAMSFFLDCFRISDIKQTLTLPHFNDYKEIEDKPNMVEIVNACIISESDIIQPMERLLGKEDFFLHDPRNSKVIKSSPMTQSYPKSSTAFDLSCENFNQNIKKITLFSQNTNSDGSDAQLKRIQLTFCDGSQRSISTETGSHNQVYTLDLGEDKRHILYLTGSWVADPLEHLLGLRFLLSDGSVLSFRGQQDYSFDRKQSVLDFLPDKFHAGNIRWIGLTGSILETSQCGDSVICNLKFKFSALTPQNVERIKIVGADTVIMNAGTNIIKKKQKKYSLQNLFRKYLQ
eukprot:GFUD01004411.1.p1 GENE.GFUD01004411.1~~GFUD01004411.1.p1  ORF type:complete len:619 (+),score=133.22 GFUD01004411.1:253-2109(+)